MRIGKTLLVISVFLIILSILLLSRDVYEDYKIESSNYKNIYNYINNVDKSNYHAVLEIPSINLKSGIVSSVDEGLVFVTDKLIAGHSGNCSYCYFDSLDKISIGDNVYLYKDVKYTYKVDTIREIDKDNVHISGDLDLITCLKSNKDRRLLVILRQIKVSN